MDCRLSISLIIKGTMNKREILRIINGNCSPFGLNLIKVLSAERANEAMAGPLKVHNLMPGAGSVVMIGNYGGRMWEILQADMEADPSKYDGHRDPVDDLSAEAIEAAVEELAGSGLRARAVYPWRQEACGWLPFQSWAPACGFGKMGLVGVVVHPEYGPWLSFRGAIILDAELEPDPPLEDFEPCAGCEAPCIEECPAGAVSREGCNVQKCLGARLFDSRCEMRCAAREACVYGGEYRFSREQITYHSFTGIQKIRRMMGH